MTAQINDAVVQTAMPGLFENVQDSYDFAKENIHIDKIPLIKVIQDFHSGESQCIITVDYENINKSNRYGYPALSPALETTLLKEISDAGVEKAMLVCSSNENGKCKFVFIFNH